MNAIEHYDHLIDDNQNDYLDMDEYKVRVYPDNPKDTKYGLFNAGFVL